MGGGGGGVEPPSIVFKEGGLDRISIFRGVCWEREGDIFQDKLKSEIFNDKINLHTIMFFSVINKNLNCYILTKNLVVLKWTLDESQLDKEKN